MGHPVSKQKGSQAGYIDETKGQFRDSSGHVANIKDIKTLGDVSDSVCIIRIEEKKDIELDGECRKILVKSQGTGFRVGYKYIMTANHVIGNVDLPCNDCYAEFNFIDINGVIPKKFNLVNVEYRNKRLDVAVVALEENSEDFPKAFMHFCPPIYSGSFELIGHSNGRQKEHNTVNKFFDQNENESIATLKRLNSLSYKYARREYGLNRDLKDSYLFHCKFTKGASGSPGVVFRGGNAYVTTMLIRGHPWWYYDGVGEEYTPFRWKDEYCIEEGVNMESLYNAMQSENKTLCDDVINFCSVLPNLESLAQ